MLIAWIEQLRQDWNDCHVVACRETHAVVANLPALLVIQPDCHLNVAARMRHTEQPRKVLRVQDVRHARKQQGVLAVVDSVCRYMAHKLHTDRMPSFVEVDIAPILAHLSASHNRWQGKDEDSSCSSTSSVLSDDSDYGPTEEAASVALALARNAAMPPDVGKQCDADAPVFQVGSPQVPGWSHAA